MPGGAAENRGDREVSVGRRPFTGTGRVEKRGDMRIPGRALLAAFARLAHRAGWLAPRRAGPDLPPSGPTLPRPPRPGPRRRRAAAELIQSRVDDDRSGSKSGRRRLLDG